jgi:hypothetical protein
MVRKEAAMAGETYWRCGECGGIHPHELSAQQCCMANSDAIEPVAVLSVEELADLRRLRDRVLAIDSMFDNDSPLLNVYKDEIAGLRAALRKETP